MKRNLLKAALIVAAVTLLCASAAAFTPETVSVDIFDTSAEIYHSFSCNQVKLTDLGEPMETDMPAFIMDARTLVPVRVISEALGAQVGWLGQSRQVTIEYGDLNITLTIGSATASVNGVQTELPDGVPATLAKIDGVQRTLVPLRFVAEVLGASIEWEAGTYTVHIDKPQEQRAPYLINALASDNEAGTLTIETAEAPDYTVKYYNGNLIIDVIGARLDRLFVLPQLTGTGLNDVRYCQYTGYEDQENVVRLVCTLKRGVVYPDNVSVSTQGSAIVVTGDLPEGTQTGGSHEVTGLSVVIDPGHGGIDPGAVSGDYHEADVNLAVALLVRDRLEQKGIRVIMTRDDDSYVSLSDRAKLANDAGADIYVSIHVNASETNPAARGIETYYLSGGGWAEILAGCIQDEIIDGTGAFSRNIKTANYYVLRETVMPAVLVETGFITNGDECMQLFSAVYRQKLAEGIAQGILSCIDMMIS